MYYRQKIALFFHYLRLIPISLFDQKAFCHTEVAYFAQWESPELIEKILAKKISPQDDPLWKRSGAISTKEYAYWSWNACGMACLKMLLVHKKNLLIPLVTLAKECLRYGGYRLPLETSPGLFYRPFCTFVKAKYGLRAKPISALTITEITHILSRRGYVIASVDPTIRTPEHTSSQKGGHLVLIIGYNKNEQALYLHNPSGSNATNQSFVKLTYKQFHKFFANKGIAVY